MLAVIISKTEPYLNGATLIKEACASLQLNCDILYIEDVLSDEKMFFQKHKSGRLIYFLTNVDSVPKCANYFEYSPRNTLINRDFLISRKTKFSVQTRLRLAGVNVPDSLIVTDENLFGEILQRLRLPLYIKSQQQTSIVIRVETEKEFHDNILGRSAENFYFEESANLEKFYLEKIYYVDGYIESKNEEFVITDILRTELKNISNVLNLDVYSADIFVSINSDTYLYIDINPSPGLFQSSEARIHLAKYILSKLSTAYDQ